MNENFENIQRAELHKKIWALADKLRGAINGWDFRQYVLGVLFYRFISEDIVEYFNEFDYTKISDEEAEKNFRVKFVEAKGFFILPSHLFVNIVKNIDNNQNLSVVLSNIFELIEASSKNMKGLFNEIDTNSEKLGLTIKERNKRLADILIGINEINFSKFKDNEIDVFGDAYEYLISNYASNAGKSGGEYFTPQTVSKLLARIVMENKKKINKVYDPTCGSGSLLLQIKKQFDENITDCEFFGQELNTTNYNLARMNMLLHGINYMKFNIKRGDTLLNPLHKAEKPFDAIISNPPYSTKWVGKDDKNLIKDERFADVGKLAPKNKSDFAFILHSLNYLSNDGRAVIVCFPGIFYRKGAEHTIRKYLIDNNVVDCIIQLCDNLFFGTTIATCILVLSKNRKTDKILFLDASCEYKKKTNKNILTEKNIEKILEGFKKRENIQYFSKNVSKDEIISNDYNLSVSKYIEKENKKEKIDINILNEKIKNTVKRIDILRKSINKLIEKK